MEDQKNFSLMSTDQLLISHDQVHQIAEASEEMDCAEIRTEHDAIAAEIARRGMEHTTPVACLELDAITDAPNYGKSFTDNACSNCVFGPVDQWCSLYKFHYISDYVCDSWHPFDTLELQPPHGFLVGKGKQTAIASDEELATDKPLLIISDSEAFGIATLGEPATMKTSEFDRKEWHDKHCVYPRERREWWADASKLYVYPIEGWQPFKPTKLFVDGKVASEPELSNGQQALIHKAKQLPKQILIASDVVGVCEASKFIIDPAVSDKCGLEETLAATYETEVKQSEASEFLPVYSLALVRNPRMRMAKKNENEPEVAIKQEEGENMPWRIETRGDEFCVVKVDNDEVEGCHGTEDEANAQLAALNISEQEGENAYSDDPKKRRRRRKKEPQWRDALKNAYSAIGDFLKRDDKEMDFPEDMFKSNSGFAIKTVNGQPWHFTWSANAFEDREKEIFSTKALEQYVFESEQKDDRGFFNLWHIPFTDFAEKKWQAVVGKFLVEAGPYLDNELGQSAAKFFNEFSNGHPDIAPEGWGCSVEFKYLPEERITGVYDWLWVTRTSTLPRSAAANIWTEIKQEEIIMTPEQKELLTTMSGDEGLAESIEALGIKKTQELEEANIASKDKENDEQPEPETEDKEVQPATEINLDMDELAEAVGKHFEVNFGAIGEAVSVITDGLKQLKADVEQLKSGAKAKEQTETPRYILNVKRASETEETVVDDSDDLKDQKPQERHETDGSMGNIFFSSKNK